MTTSSSPGTAARPAAHGRNRDGGDARSTQRVDLRWGSSLVRESKGRIEDGVLTTEPVGDLVVPWQNLSVPSIHIFRDARLQVRLSPNGAEGLLAGYADVEKYYFQLIRND